MEIFNKYGIKATFNINSELLGKKNTLIREGVSICHDKIAPEEVATLYRGHEVAVHTLTHPQLPLLPEQEIIRQVEEDRKNLSRLVGYEVVGMAYPCGGFQNSDRVEKAIRKATGVKYARTISLSYSFANQANLLRFNPTAHHLDFDTCYRLANEFFEMEGDGIFYIWGHSYEFDINDTWGEFEEFCKFISGREGIVYATNKELLL